MRPVVNAFTAAAMTLALTACGPAAPDEERIREAILGMAQALAESDVRGFLAPLADDFSGVTWDLDERGARLLLQRELRARERLRARVFDISVELRGESRAVADFQVVLTGGSGLIPETGRWYRVESGWRLDGNDWKLVSAQWEAVAGR
jgi:hypothetical protein